MTFVIAQYSILLNIKIFIVRKESNVRLPWRQMGNKRAQT